MFLTYSSLLNHRFTCPTAFLPCPFGCLMGISILACPTRTPDTCTGTPPPSPASSIACPFSVNSHFILPVAQAKANIHPFTLPHLSFVWLSTSLRVKAKCVQGFPLIHTTPCLLTTSSAPSPSITLTCFLLNKSNMLLSQGFYTSCPLCLELSFQ